MNGKSNDGASPHATALKKKKKYEHCNFGTFAGEPLSKEYICVPVFLILTPSLNFW